MNTTFIWIIFAVCACATPFAYAQTTCRGDNVTVQFKTSTFPVQKVGSAILFRTGMEVDVDGAPNAYGPDNSGLDFTANAKDGSKFVGVVTDAEGKPVIQESGAFKGFYVSTTSLHAAHANERGPATYVDATKIAYIVLPPEMAKQFGIVLGDLAVVTNRENGKSSFAIYADVGPHGKVGEGSVALAEAIGLNPSPRHGGTSKPIVSYLVFPETGLGQGKLRSSDEINTSAGKEFATWGGNERLKACLSENH